MIDNLKMIMYSIYSVRNVRLEYMWNDIDYPSSHKFDVKTFLNKLGNKFYCV